MSLALIGQKHGSDKFTVHHYDPFYERHLAPFAGRAASLLEIGVNKGASLRVWREYLPSARIFGIDIAPGAARHVPEGAAVFIGDQTDLGFLADVVAQTGPLDIVIDDGGHSMTQQQVSFRALFPSVAPGGLYIIEDLATSYYARYGGGPKGMAGTTVMMLKDLVDGVVLARGQIREMHVYQQICFMTKAP